MRTGTEVLKIRNGSHPPSSTSTLDTDNSELWALLSFKFDQSELFALVNKAPSSSTGSTQPRSARTSECRGIDITRLVTLIQIEKIQIYDLWRMIGDHLQIIYRSRFIKILRKFQKTWSNGQTSAATPGSVGSWRLARTRFAFRSNGSSVAFSSRTGASGAPVAWGFPDGVWRLVVRV